MGSDGDLECDLSELFSADLAAGAEGDAGVCFGVRKWGVRDRWSPMAI